MEPVEIGSPVGDVRTESPDSPPSEASGEGTEEEREDERAPKRVIGKPFDSESGRHAGLLSASRSRKTPTDAPDDAETILRELLRAQRDIARGNGKGTTSAQQTAAAREVRDILSAIAQLPKREEGISWHDVPEVQRRACAAVLERPESFAYRVLKLAEHASPE